MTIDDFLEDKLRGKTPDQKKALRYYYRRKFESGTYGKRNRKPEKDYETEFLTLVKNSCDPASGDFLTKRLRKIKHLHLLLENRLGKKVNIRSLYYLVQKHDLNRYLKLNDTSDERAADVKLTFPEFAPYEMIQIDGCKMRYFKIKGEDNKWYAPIAISAFDTGSRFILASSLYQSENLEAGVEVFNLMLKNQFPKGIIRIRPDNSKAFLNIKRLITEVNINSSDVTFVPDFSRVRKYQDKIHLERWHRDLHEAEFSILMSFTGENYVEEKLIGRKVEKITVKYLDASLDDLRKIYAEIIDRHNKSEHIYVNAGVRQKWIPSERIAIQKDMITLQNIDLSMYVFEKTKILIPKSREFVFRGIKYHIMGNFNSVRTYRASGKSKYMRISLKGSEAYLFEDTDDGIMVIAAFAATESSKEPYVRRKNKKESVMSEFEMTVKYLEKKGMSVNQEKLSSMFKDGLTYEKTVEIYSANKDRYDKYPGFAGFNFFIADVIKADEYIPPFLRTVNEEDIPF